MEIITLENNIIMPNSWPVRVVSHMEKGKNLNMFSCSHVGGVRGPAGHF